MLVGQYFFRIGAGVVQFSPSFPRAGLAAVFSVEAFALTPATVLTVSVQYRNFEDTSWTTYGVAMNVNAVGVFTLEVAGGIKEEVRFRYQVSGSNASDMVYANVLAPQWRPY